MTKPDKIVDALLVVSFKTGNKKAMDLLVRRWNDRVCVHAYGYVKNWAWAKDITQETWSIVLAKVHFLRDNHQFGSWVMTIASRKAIDGLKRQQKQRKLANDWSYEQRDTTTSDVGGKAKKLRRIQAIMDQLPIDQRLVLKLFYLEEYSLKEISKITGATVSTVKTRLFRAREKIKEELKKTK